MRELGQCVEAMINEAIAKQEYDLCKERLENIMDRMKLLVQNFEALTPENADDVIQFDIMPNIAEITGATSEYVLSGILAESTDFTA